MSLYSDVNALKPTEKPQLTDFEAVNMALITLFNTRPGEVAFNPEFGIDLEEELFELIDEISAAAIYSKVFVAINRFEPRVIIDNANSSLTPFPDENKYELTLVFSIQGMDETQKFELIGNFSGTKIAG